MSIFWSQPNTYDRPPLIWIAPKPSDVATPKIVANTTKKSINVPHGPLTSSPKSGSKTAMTTAGDSLRNLKYASAKASVAYTPHGCNPQWKKLYCSAVFAAPFVSVSPYGGSWKCDMGSAAPQKTSPIPIPALNNIANQVM